MTDTPNIDGFIAAIHEAIADGVDPDIVENGIQASGVVREFEALIAERDQLRADLDEIRRQADTDEATLRAQRDAIRQKLTPEDHETREDIRAERDALRVAGAYRSAGTCETKYWLHRCGRVATTHYDGKDFTPPMSAYPSCDCGQHSPTDDWDMWELLFVRDGAPTEVLWQYGIQRPTNEDLAEGRTQGPFRGDIEPLPTLAHPLPDPHYLRRRPVAPIGPWEPIPTEGTS